MLRPHDPRRFLSLLGLLLACACDTGGGPPMVFSEAIGHLGRGYRRLSLTVSHDLGRYAWIDSRDERCRVVVDGERGPLLYHCVDPRFSRDGEVVAYWGVPEPGEPPQGYLYVDGQPQPVAAGRDGPIAFSRSGGGWAAIAPAYDPDFDPTSLTAAPPDPTPTPTAGGPAAPSPAAPEPSAQPTAQGSPAADASAPHPSQRRRLVAFWKRGILGEHADMTTPALSFDGSHVAYVATNQEGVASLFVDGVVRRTFGAPEIKYLPVLRGTPEQDDWRLPSLGPEYGVHYLSDGSLVTVALAEQGYTVFHDDEIWASYPAVQIPKTGFEVIDPSLLVRRTMVAGSLSVASDAPVACWWERLEGERESWRVVCNAEPADDQVCDFPFPELPITISADGRTRMYVCRMNPPLGPDGMPAGPPQLWVVIRGERLGPYQFAWSTDLTPDGRHFAFAAAESVDTPWFYVVDGRRYDGPWLQVFPPKLSPGGSSVVWAATREEEPEEEDRRMDLVFNGNLVARADVVMAPPLWRGDHKVEWAVRRGSSVRKLVVCDRWTPFEWLRPLLCR